MISNCRDDMCYYKRYVQQMETIRHPVLGLMPKWRYEELKAKERLQDVMDAIKRYWDADKQIPIEWVEEYNNLISKENKE